jgi:predicted RNA-binding protein with PIN domain
MPYLIDGNNLIGHIPHLRLNDPQSRYRLVARLLIFQRRRKTKIVLVFDGPPDLNLFGEKYRRKKFAILYPDFDQNADTIIQEQVLKQTDLRNFFVVSSDREIKAFAKNKGAKVLTCQQFYRQLKAVLKDYKNSLSLKKEDFSLSPFEVKQWLEIFDKKNE